MITDDKIKEVYEIVNPTSSLIIPFKYWDTEEIEVYATKPDGSIDKLVRVRDYSILGSTKVQFPIPGILPTQYSRITILRNVALKQNTDYADGAILHAEEIEKSFDKLTAMVQQVSEKVGRAITSSVDSEPENEGIYIPDKEYRKGKLLGFSADGKSIELYDRVSGIGNVTAEAHSLSSDSDPTVEVITSEQSGKKNIHFKFGVPKGTTPPVPPTPTETSLSIVLNPNIKEVCFKVNDESTYRSVFSNQEFTLNVGDVIFLYAVANDGYTTEYGISNPLSVILTADGYTFSPNATPVVPPVKDDLFHFKGLEDNTIINLSAYGIDNPQITLEYSLDALNWNNYIVGTDIRINAEDNLYFRNSSDTIQNFSEAEDRYYHFVIDKQTECIGNVMYLVDKTGETLTIPNEYCFKSLFSNGQWGLEDDRVCKITTAPELPASTLKSSCYSSMFAYCNLLESAPVLPASNLGFDTHNCYYMIFYKCTSLTNLEVHFTSWISPNGDTYYYTYGWSVDLGLGKNVTFRCPSSLPTLIHNVSAMHSNWIREDIN